MKWKITNNKHCEIFRLNERLAIKKETPYYMEKRRID